MKKYISIILFIVLSTSCGKIIDENVDKKLSNRIIIDRQDSIKKNNDVERVIIRDSIMNVKVFKPRSEK